MGKLDLNTVKFVTSMNMLCSSTCSMPVACINVNIQGL